MASLYHSFIGVGRGCTCKKRLVHFILPCVVENISVEYSALFIEMLFGCRYLYKVVGVFIFAIL